VGTENREAPASGGYSSTDPNRPSAIESDPLMAQFWANQELTPGTD
jgi:hypothetical protein